MKRADVPTPPTEPPPSQRLNETAPDIARASIPEALAGLRVRPDTGLSSAEVEARRREHGYNEVAEKSGHPLLAFLRKFWGLSAWMLELIMVLSAVLGKYSDLGVVGALLVVNAVLGFTQEHRAAGAVQALRRRLQVNARALREASWQVLPARELVPGDIVRMRSGDIVPADVKLLTGALTVDQSALTGESKEVERAPGDVLSSGAVVRRGEGNGVVILIGAKTYFGRTTELVQQARPKLHIESVVAKVELGRREVHRNPVDARAPRLQVDRNAAYDEAGRFGGDRWPYNGTNPQEQLTKAEWLGDEIVGSSFEAFDPGWFVRPSGNHDNANTCQLLSRFDAPAHGSAAHVG